MSKWKTIKEAPLYEASIYGEIRRNNKVLKPNTNGNSDHLWVTLRVEGRSLKRYVHRLVLSTFIGECPPHFECRHLDGNPNNNHLYNLVWGSKSENYNDARKHGTNTKGSIHGMSKLTETQVRKILKIRKSGERPCNIGPRFNVTPQTISKICCGNSWKQL